MNHLFILIISGVGGRSHNFVYRFAPWKDLGCWHDRPEAGRTMTLLENFRSSIDWFHLEITGTVNTQEYFRMVKFFLP